MRPLVLGPGAVPVIVEEEQARQCPELAVLSAMAHGRGEVGAKVGEAALSALSSLGAST